LRTEAISLKSRGCFVAPALAGLLVMTLFCDVSNVIWYNTGSGCSGSEKVVQFVGPPAGELTILLQVLLEQLAFSFSIHLVLFPIEISGVFI